MQKDYQQLAKQYDSIPSKIIAKFTTKIPELVLQPIQIHIETEFDEENINNILKALLLNILDQQTLDKLKFQFLIEAQLLRGQLKSHILRYNISCEKTIEIQYVLGFHALQNQKSQQQDDWISNISQIMSFNDNAFIASLFSGCVSVYDEKGKHCYKQRLQQSIIKKLKVLPCDTEGQYYFISGGIDQQLKVHKYSPQSKQSDKIQQLSVNEHQSAISDISCNPLLDGMFCSIGGSSLNIWQIPTNLAEINNEAKTSKTKKRHLTQQKLNKIASQTFAESNCVNWSRNDQIIVSSLQHKINLIDVERLRVQQTILTKDSITTSIATSKDQILTSHEDGYIRLWDRRNLQHPTITFKSHSKLVSEILFNVNSNIFASGSYDHSVKIWDIRSIFPLQNIDSHTDKVFSIYWKSQHEIISGGSDSKIYFHSI